MENGYLGGGILAGTFILMALAYLQFRQAKPPRFLDNETTAMITGYVLTAAIAIGITLFVSNAYLTDTFSTVVSTGIVLSAFLALALTVARSRTAPATTGLEPYTPAPFTPETPPANANKPASGRGRSRRKVA
jgi:L-asparagine transporter-like permease